MALLSSIFAVEVAAPSGMWEWLLLNLFDFVTNYGWRVVVFTILLKLLLSPLDFFQKYKMKKNERISKKLKPQLEKLQKQYAGDPKTLQSKQMELNKREGYSYFSACIPMIVTLVVFITLFNGMRSISAYMEFKQYANMYEAYRVEVEDLTHLDKLTGDKHGDWENADFSPIDNLIKRQYELLTAKEELSEAEKKGLVHYKDAVENKRSFKYYIDRKDQLEEKAKTESGLSDEEKQELDFMRIAIENLSLVAQTEASVAAKEYYQQNHASFLWIKSLWVPDVSYKNAVPDYKTFKANVGNYLKVDKNKGKIDSSLLAELSNEATYNDVTYMVRQDKKLNKNNGYFILVVLTIGLNFLSQLLASRQQKKANGGIEQAGGGTMKIMMFMMPLILAVFAFTYTAAFSLYMVASAFSTIGINLLTSGILKLVDKVKAGKTATVEVVKYGRADPHDQQQKNDKKKK